MYLYKHAAQKCLLTEICELLNILVAAPTATDAKPDFSIRMYDGLICARLGVQTQNTLVSLPNVATLCLTVLPNINGLSLQIAKLTNHINGKWVDNSHPSFPMSG